MENPYLRLKELMAERNISGKKLAETLETRPATISDIVNGKTQPRFELLQKIANILEVEMADLFSRRDSHSIYIKVDGVYKEVGFVHSSSLNLD